MGTLSKHEDNTSSSDREHRPHTDLNDKTVGESDLASYDSGCALKMVEVSPYKEELGGTPSISLDLDPHVILTMLFHMLSQSDLEQEAIDSCPLDPDNQFVKQTETSLDETRVDECRVQGPFQYITSMSGSTWGSLWLYSP